MITIAVDPGLRACGVAVFSGGQLAWAGYVRSSEAKARGGSAWIAMALAVAEALTAQLGPAWVRPGLGVVEYPQQYEGAGHKADREDISELTDRKSVV